jgi:hypothetical protein
MHNRDQLLGLARMSLAIKDPRPRAKVQALALGFLCGEKPKTIRKSAPLRRKIALLFDISGQCQIVATKRFAISSARGVARRRLNCLPADRQPGVRLGGALGWV